MCASIQQPGNAFFRRKNAEMQRKNRSFVMWCSWNDVKILSPNFAWNKRMFELKSKTFTSFEMKWRNVNNLKWIKLRWIVCCLKLRIRNIYLFIYFIHKLLKLAVCCYNTVSFSIRYLTAKEFFLSLSRMYAIRWTSCFFFSSHTTQKN